MKVNKEELLSTLKQDVKSSESFQQSWMTKVKEWRKETLGSPYGNETKGRSSLVSKDIKKQLEWLLPSMADPFLSSNDIVKCSPITYEDVQAAKQAEILLNTQFCRKFNRYNFTMKALRVLATEGTVVIRTGWEYEDKEETALSRFEYIDVAGNVQMGSEETTVTKVIKNQPTAVVCRNEDIYLDPACMDEMDKCQFVCHRYETDMSTLKADGRYKNLDKIGESNRDGDFIPQDRTDFQFKDKARKKLLVYEYWGNYDITGDGTVTPIVCAWIGDTIIRLEENPYPDGKPPFIIVPFNAVPFEMTGEALAENIGDNQKVKTAILRGIIDNMAKSNNGQVGFKIGGLDAANRKRFLQGDNFEYRGEPGDFWQGGYNQIAGSAFDVMSLMNNEIESQTGVKSFSGGINSGSLGSVATGVRAALDATAVRRMNQVRSLSENLFKPLMRKWLSYNAEFLEEEEVIRVTNEEYVPIRRDDLEGNLDIDLNISTAEDNMSKSQELSFLLQTLGNTVPFSMTKIILAKLAELSKMPDLEKMITEYEEERDPLVDELRELEIENLRLTNEKLISEIERNLARAAEDQVDIELKSTKAEVEKAKADKLTNEARKIASEADTIDLRFLKEDSQIDSINKFEEKEREREYNLMLEQLRRSGSGKYN